MRYVSGWRRTVVAAWLLGSSSWGIAASAIVFEAVDLTDATVGRDLWQYRYSVGGNFPAFHGFEIEFDVALVAAIEATPAAPNADWFVSTTPPAPGIPLGGVYAALALTDSPALAQPFVVDFVRKGAGVPGPQRFDLVDDQFALIGSGMTTPVPEPHSYLLFGAGVLLLLARRCSRRVPS